MWDLQYQYKMKFICKNPECDRFDIEEIEPTVIIGFKDGVITYDRLECPVCKQKRDYIEPFNGDYKDKGVNVKSLNKRLWSKTTKGTLY